jgi:hypothetical protein
MIPNNRMIIRNAINSAEPRRARPDGGLLLGRRMILGSTPASGASSRAGERV